MILGGGLKGGQILGTYPERLDEDGDVGIGKGILLPTTSWESMWQPILQWLGVEDEQLDTVLPNRPNFPASDLMSQTDMFE